MVSAGDMGIFIGNLDVADSAFPLVELIDIIHPIH